MHQLLFFSILLLPIVACHKPRLAPIYWNTSNPLFKPSTSTEPIEVQMYYEIDIICPYYPSYQPPSQQETYIIYQVSKKDYDNCMLGSGTSMLVNCSAPFKRRRFTIIFQTFQAVANAPHYEEGQTYFVISTSTGSLDGLANRQNGVCASKHMKVAFYVMPSDLTKVKPNQPTIAIHPTRTVTLSTTTIPLYKGDHYNSIHVYNTKEDRKDSYKTIDYNKQSNKNHFHNTERNKNRINSTVHERPDYHTILRNSNYGQKQTRIYTTNNGRKNGLNFNILYSTSHNANNGKIHNNFQTFNNNKNNTNRNNNSTIIVSYLFLVSIIYRILL